MTPVPVKVNGIVVGHGFIDDSGQLHIRIEENEYYDMIVQGLNLGLSVLREKISE